MRFKSRLKRAFLNFVREITTSPALSEYYPVPLPLPETGPLQVFENQLLAKKNVLITGAGRNIGKHIALEMAKQGANIYFTDINRERCLQLEQALAGYNIKFKSFVSNIAKPNNVDSLVSALQTDGVNIDILVNNAGIELGRPSIKDFDWAEWHQVFDTNVIGPMYLTKLIAQMMIDTKTQGAIIFITSTHQWTIRRDPNYSATKGALGMIVKELAIDLTPYGIRVNGIAPGLVFENSNGHPVSDRYVPLYNSSIPPCYIGRAAVYLACNYFSQYTTGTVLKIDAGASLYNHNIIKRPPQ